MGCCIYTDCFSFLGGIGSGASCQAFSLAVMPGYQGEAGTGLTLCYL
jgi:hypothetical protein